MNSAMPTIADSGLPGRPNTSVLAAAAEPQRLAGLDPHAPEDLLDAARLERGLDVVVRADRDAAGDDQHVALAGPRSTAARVASRSSAIDAVVDDRAPARSASSARPSARWTRGSCPARAARRAAAARCR